MSLTDYTMVEFKQAPLPAKPFLRIAVPVPLRRLFDYHMPAVPVYRGQRIKIPFGPRQVIGIAVAAATSTDIPQGRIRPVTEVLDAAAISESMLDLLLWAADYYHYPPGEVIMLALPPPLRRSVGTRRAGRQMSEYWQLASDAPDPNSLKRSPKQSSVLQLLADSTSGVMAKSDLLVTSAVLRALIKKQWIVPADAINTSAKAASPLVLTAEQAQAVKTICSMVGKFQPVLLEGVTGSGKTEVYLQAISYYIEQGLQALVLVPEIGLTPQVYYQFSARFPDQVAVIHSGVSAASRRDAWLSASQGQTAILLGTRAAFFTPMPRLGLIVIDEEHDSSYKQQDGFRYSARDLAVKYAGELQIPVVLGSATPSLESIANTQFKRYQHLRLCHRVPGVAQPDWQLLDVRSQPKEALLADVTIEAIQEHLAADRQVLLFLNRRGIAPVLMCKKCNWVLDCDRCDAHMVLHKFRYGLRMLCHHCTRQIRVPSSCGACGKDKLFEVGAGVQKLEAFLRQHFADVEVLRFDTDISAASRLEKLARVENGKRQILVGTQILTKGHDFSNLTLTVIVNIDAGLFAPDFRATERVGQMITQVAGRAGRLLPGKVIIQTQVPHHPVLQTLLNEGYGAFARQSLQERKLAVMPPFAYLAMFRAEARTNEMAFDLLQWLATQLRRRQIPSSELEIWGPAAPAIERKVGLFHQHLVLCAQKRSQLQRTLKYLITLLEANKKHPRVRWSIEVDPIDLF